MSTFGPLPRVGIVILNWNGYRVTRRCLDSLRTVDYPARTVYLLDNGSTDDSWARLSSECAGDGVVLMANGENLGFAAGCNPGIRRALEDGCDFVLLLNNDTLTPRPDFLRAMVDLARSDPRIGLVGGRILLYPATHMLWCTGGIIGWFGERYLGLNEPDDGQYAEVADRQFVSGALMLIRREVFDSVGLLPEEYFFGHEDWEFAFRVRREGWRIVYQPRAVIQHEAGSSHVAFNPTWVYNDTLSKILFKKRTLRAPSYALWIACYTLYLELLFDLRHRLQPGLLPTGVEPALIRTAMRDALRDAASLERVTRARIEGYRLRGRHPAR